MINIQHVPIGEEWEDRLLIAINEEGEVVGHARVWDNYSKLTELYVSPGKRNKQVGFLLLVEGAALAKVRGHRIITGYCKKELLRFYEQYGLKIVEEPDEEGGLYTVEFLIP